MSPKPIYFLSFRNDWTKTTHMRAIDVWVVLCYVGVFYALMEYCIIIYLTKVFKSTEKKPKKQEPIRTEENMVTISAPNGAAQILNKPESKDSMNISAAENLERFSRIILPLYNILFSITYFTVCIEL